MLQTLVRGSFRSYNFLGARSIRTSILCDSYHFAVTKLAFPLLVEASWFLIKPWILRIGYIIAQPCRLTHLLPFAPQNFGAFGMENRKYLHTYPDEMVWFSAKGDVRWGTARTRKSHTNDYPAVDLTFDGKLRPHCVLNCVDFCRTWKFT